MCDKIENSLVHVRSLFMGRRGHPRNVHTSAPFRLSESNCMHSVLEAPEKEGAYLNCK